jgi:hypothetical protein
MSERTLAYSEEPIKHRFLVIYEAEGMSGDFATYLIRSLLSDGRVRYETVKKSAVGSKLTQAKPATTVAGIGGYYGGPSRMNSQETQKLPAHVEARLMILRSKQRAAAHDMRDRGKSKAARDAAELDWARARQEAEKLERHAAQSIFPYSS